MSDDPAEPGDEIADRRLHDFAHHMGHDLKSPMASLLGAVELLSRESFPPEHQELLDMIQRAADRLVVTIDGLVAEADLATDAVEDPRHRRRDP